MDFGKRKYRYKGADTGSEQRNFWIWIVVALTIGAAIIYFF